MIFRSTLIAKWGIKILYNYTMENQKKTILIIDDDADFREILKTKLTASGFKVDQAENGEQGLEKAKKIKPDLVLLDVRMPKMNGIQTLSKIRADLELGDLKVLFLTNLGELDPANSWVDDKFAKNIGAVGHIMKTDDLEKILERVKKELNENTY